MSYRRKLEYEISNIIDEISDYYKDVCAYIFDSNPEIIMLDLEVVLLTKRSISFSAIYYLSDGTKYKNFIYRGAGVYRINNVDGYVQGSVFALGDDMEKLSKTLLNLLVLKEKELDDNYNHQEKHLSGEEKSNIVKVLGAVDDEYLKDYYSISLDDIKSLLNVASQTRFRFKRSN